MKLKSYNLLFRLFSFLSDRTNGAPFFVKYKLILGTLLLGIVSSSKAREQNNEAICDDTIIEDFPAVIMCYEPTVPLHDQTDSITVRGCVKDETKEPLAGVTVLVKGTATGTVTDLKGNFSIASKPNETLVFSFLGCRPKEIPVAELKNDTTVTMEDDSIKLSCYIVIVADYQREIEIQGIVRDREGHALPGVVIRVKDSANGSLTDGNGKFSMKVKSRDRLQFSYIGYKKKDIPVSQMIENNPVIVLEEEDMILCYEVVISKDGQ